MQLKLKQSIRAKGQQHRPPSVVDTAKLGISDKEAEVLILRGVAVLYTEAAEAEQAPAPGAPEVIDASVEQPANEDAGQPAVTEVQSDDADAATTENADAAAPAEAEQAPASRRKRGG